jgi:uridine phosphorylase
MNLKNLNPHIQNLEVDHLYHIGLDSSMDLASLFGNIKYVVFTLSNAEAGVVARQFAQIWYNITEEKFTYQPIYKTERFHMYKVGLTLIISIGVGMPSLLIGMNEVTKILMHIKHFDVTFFKIGFAGGIGVNPGDVIISNNVVNGKFEAIYNSIECGETFTYPTVLDHELANYLLYFNHSIGRKNVTIGTTLSTKDFYDEQARVNGALPITYTQQECDAYLTRAYEFGIRAIDMESLVFAGFCNQLEIAASIIGIVVVDRLEKDDIQITMNDQMEYLSSSSRILARYIKSICY